MKRTIALLLVLAMSCVCLFGCGDDLRETIKEHRGEYDYTPPVTEEITLDVYIVGDDYRETASDALPSNKGVYDAVKRQIDLYTTETYHTSLVIHYISSAMYEETVKNNLDTADIVLITSKDMMDELVEEEKLANLTDFFASNTYGSLNVTIAEALLEASMYDGKYYAVPNNRPLGSYTYALINKASLHSDMKYPLASLAEFPYVLSLDTVHSDAAVATLVRSLIAKDMIATKDAALLAALQTALFNTMVVDVFDTTYVQGATPTETIATAKELVSMLTEEELDAVAQKLLVDNGIEQSLDEILTVQNIDASKDENKYLEYATKVQLAFQELKSAYMANYLNYGFEEGDRAYPALETLIGRYVDEQMSAEDNVLLADDLFTADELAALIDYKTTYAEYAELTADAFVASEAIATEDVVIISGAAYEDKVAYEAAGWICNVLSYPMVDKEVAFTSAFAVVAQEGIDPARAMEIIYAIHTDAQLRHLLLFGIENINYALDGETVVRNEEALYFMNPLYVGNMFLPYYSEEFTAEDAANGLLQNKQATYVEPVTEPEDGE